MFERKKCAFPGKKTACQSAAIGIDICPYRAMMCRHIVY